MNCESRMFKVCHWQLSFNFHFRLILQHTIEGMRSIMATLHESRQREATIDADISSLLDTYALLEQTLPDGIITKEEMDAR
jgi:hypothetical protein